MSSHTNHAAHAPAATHGHAHADPPDKKPSGLQQFVVISAVVLAFIGCCMFYKSCNNALDAVKPSTAPVYRVIYTHTEPKAEPAPKPPAHRDTSFVLTSSYTAHANEHEQLDWDETGPVYLTIDGVLYADGPNKKIKLTKHHRTFVFERICGVDPVTVTLTYHQS